VPTLRGMQVAPAATAHALVALVCLLQRVKASADADPPIPSSSVRACIELRSGCETLIILNVLPDAELCAGSRCEFRCTSVACGRAE
jgi:hypothetical protein